MSVSHRRPAAAAAAMAAMFLSFLILATMAAQAATDPGDAAAMLDLANSLPASKLAPLRWDLAADPCASWKGVLCAGDRVSIIHAGGSSLAGTLPATIVNLTALKYLELNKNNISGALPSFNGLSSLQSLYINNNAFSLIPPDFFSGLKSLQSVTLDYNPFDPWPFPDSLRSCASLVNFSATSTNISGVLPDFIGTAFPTLSHLSLAFNLLQGPIPASFGSSSVQSLWLNNQRSPGLSGGVDVVANMTSLTQIWLQSNSFSGALPDFSWLTALSELNLRDNHITGPVPGSLLSLKSLKSLTLTNNMLQGPVPVIPDNVTDVDLKVSTESFCLPIPGKCDDRVSALLSIVKGFGYPARFAENWKGNDPCKSWVGVMCDANGSVVTINFQNMGLDGMISPDFQMLKSLQKVLLSNNNLTGIIPPELAKLTYLKQLDVSNNSLSGSVPKFAVTVVVITLGNPSINIDGTPGAAPVPGGSASMASGSSSSPSHAGVIAGSVVGGLCAMFLIGFMGLRYYKKKQKPFGRVQSTNAVVVHPPRRSLSDPDTLKISIAAGSNFNGGLFTSGDSCSQSDSGKLFSDSGKLLISVQVLKNLTNNFSEDNVLGRGGFGTVYKGELDDGTKIAVKRMESGVMGSKGLDEFKSEITVLTKVRHRNLVSLLGYCLDASERLLVYEYMPQGTLSRHLFDWKEQGLMPLEWKSRLSIALNVARGVEYLHGLAQQSFIHRDLKPSNILLGDDMKAKVADFGLVRLAPDGKCSFIETRLAGTFGYLAPEYAATGRVTTKSDVYSFGVILMELITGRKALDPGQSEERVHLATWFRKMQLCKDTFKDVIDSTLTLDEETLASIGTVAELGGYCCAKEPSQRPDMGHAVNVLSTLSEVWKPSFLDSDDSGGGDGLDLNLSLPQVFAKWQASTSSYLDGSSSFLASGDNTQTSIPPRPPGLADSFTSSDGR